MAERVGFEPTVQLPGQRFSRPPDSAALAPLHALSVNHLACSSPTDQSARLRRGCGFARIPVFLPCVVLWVVQPTNVMPVVPLEQVRVDVQRDCDTTMSEGLLNILRIGPLLDQEGGEGMAQIMKRHPQKLYLV